MNQAANAFTQHIQLSRTLGTVALTGFRSLMSFQFDQAQSFTARSSSQVRTALTKSGESRDLARVPELMRDWIGGAGILVRDAISGSIDYQLEMLRLVSETRAALAESINEQFAPVDRSLPRSRRTPNNAAAEQPA